MTPCTGVNRCTMLSLSISFFLFLFFSPLSTLYPLSLFLSLFPSHRPNTHALCYRCMYRLYTVVRTNVTTWTHVHAVVLYTCVVYVPGRRLRAPLIFMVRYGTKIKEASRIASRYSLVNTSLACFVSRKRIVGIHSGRFHALIFLRETRLRKSQFSRIRIEPVDYE